MKLPRPPQRYDERFQQQQANEIERELRRCHKKGENIELGITSLILTAPNGTRYALSVDNSGNLSAVAV